MEEEEAKKKLRGLTSQQYQPSDCHVVSVTDPYGRILDFLERSRYFFF
jgi:hypothetical protein